MRHWSYALRSRRVGLNTLGSIGWWLRRIHVQAQCRTTTCEIVACNSCVGNHRCSCCNKCFGLSETLTRLLPRMIPFIEVSYANALVRTRYPSPATQSAHCTGAPKARMRNPLPEAWCCWPTYSRAHGGHCWCRVPEICECPATSCPDAEGQSFCASATLHHAMISQRQQPTAV